MAESLIIDWLDENRYRSYPLRPVGDRVANSTTGVLADAFILDASLVFSEALPDSIELETITFTGSGPYNAVFGITGQSYAFTLTDVDNATYPVKIRNAVGSLLVIGEDIKKMLNQNKTFTGVLFEPCVCRDVSAYAGVTSLTLNGVELDLSPGLLLTTGAVVDFQEGYQVYLSATTGSSVVTLKAGRNYGVPIGCASFFPDLPDDCGTIVSSINGVSPTVNYGDIPIVPGRNIAVFPDKENHRIYIGLNFEQGGVCSNPVLGALTP